MDWYRWWHGTYTDPKFQMVANDCGISLACVLGIWSAMLEQASANDPRGSFKFDAEVMSFHLGIDCVTPCNAMKRRGLLHETDEMLHVANWEKRQPKRERNDNSTERVRACRERKKEDVTPCNAMKRQETPRLDKKRIDKTYLPDDFSISESVRKWATSHGYTRLEERLSHFIDWAKAGNKQYADWDATFRNAIRGDWAKLGAASTVPVRRDAPSLRELVC